MKLLDLFCGAGGASMGYAQAGFAVFGVDIAQHPDYPFPQINTDAMAFLANVEALDEFDVIAASPPCPRYSVATGKNRDKHPDFVQPVREFLQAWGGPYVIENVPGAPLLDPLLLCGSMFGMKVRRHRLFESNIALQAPGPCTHKRQGQVYGIYGQHADRPGGFKRPDGKSRGLKATSVRHAQELMGIDWMHEWSDLADAIPPCYTKWIGTQLADVLEAAA